MELRMCTAPRESEASLARRARVLAYRMSRGELVAPPAWDPVWSVLFDMLASGPRVPCGNAAGAVPEVM